MKKIAFLVAVFGLILVACATTPQTPPTGGITAECPTLILGSKFIFQETNLSTKKITQTITWTIEKRGLYDGKEAYWVRVDVKKSAEDIKTKYAVYMIRDLNLNPIAVIAGDKETVSISPYIQDFSWPLFAGKKWYASYDLYDKGQWFRNIKDSVVVESHEEIVVPAGSFKTFKIKRFGDIASFTSYHAPEIRGIMVKREIVRDSSHYQGGGRWVQELVEYNVLERR